MSKPKLNERPEDFFRTKQLILEGKHNETLQLIDKFKEKEDSTLHDILLYNLLKCEILYQQGLYKDVVKLAEQTFQESLGLGDSLLSIDARLNMVEPLILLGDPNKAEEIIKQSEDLLKTQIQESSIEYKLREALIFHVKAWFYTWVKHDADQALEHLEYSIKLYTECGAKKGLIRSLGFKVLILANFKGEIDLALKLAERYLALSKESNYKYYITMSLFVMAIIYGLKGELDRSIKLNEQCLTNFKELNNKFYIGTVFSNTSYNYLRKGELDRALESTEQALSIFTELGALINIVGSYDSIIQILIEMGDIERAQQYLDRLEQLNNQSKENYVNSLYLFNKALLLKTSRRAYNRGIAENILKQILEEENLDYDLTVGVLLNLCELLLTELQLLNDLEILNEIESYITRLLDLAEKSHSYTLLAETYYIKGKLALLTLDVKKARRFLTQAQRIAERWNYISLAIKISTEHEKLQNQTGMWEELKGTDITLAERIKLAGLDEQMDQLLRKRLKLTPQVKEEEVTIHREKKICLVCKGDVLGYMYTCQCDSIYCEKCARALTDLENVCWVCDTPIDISKPTKPYKEEEAEEKDIIKKTPKKPKNHKL